MSEAARLRCGGEGGYDVVVGADLVPQLPALLGPQPRRVLVAYAAPVGPLARAVADTLAPGRVVVTRALPDAEAAKTAAVAQDLWAVLGQHEFTRTDAVVAVGGGSVTDLAGFVAATWLRGVPVIHVPTTVLAMVDAAVGGKTGINTAEGKNLVGSFHPPAGVLCDLSVLVTLPKRDVAAGLAEVIKAGFIADPAILDLVESDPEGALRADSPTFGELVVRAIRVKVDVVTADLREASHREILNYGHTFAHAVEQVSGYRWRHGEAVAVGMVYAAELAAAAGLTDAALVARHRAVLGLVGLPTALPPGSQLAWPDLATAMRRDKKSRGDQLRFVVLPELARPSRLAAPRQEWLEQAYQAVRAADG